MPDSPADPSPGPGAASADWAGLLDAVVHRQVRVTVTAPDGEQAVLIGAQELAQLEVRAERSRSARVVLTARERQALLLVEEGLSLAQVAERLGVAPGTAVQHLAAARRKYDVPSSAQAATAARLAGHLD